MENYWIWGYTKGIAFERKGERYMSKFYIRPIVLLLVLFLWMPKGHSEIIERVVAVVNNDVVTQSELDDLIRPVFEQYRTVYQGQEFAEKMTEARRKLLNQLIEDKLVYQEAQEKGVVVSEGEIDGRIIDFKKRFKNPQDFQRILSAQGMSLKKLREKYRQQIAVRKLNYFEVRNKVLVSPKEVREYYEENEGFFVRDEQVRISGITIRKAKEFRDKVDEDAKFKAEQILSNIQNGADFGKVAEAQSEDYQASNGGDMGFVGRGELAPTIDEVIFALKPQQLSQVIETEVGYHIFRVEERSEKEKKTLEDVRKDIRGILYRKKAGERFDEWLKELKAKAYISIR